MYKMCLLWYIIVCLHHLVGFVNMRMQRVWLMPFYSCKIVYVLFCVIIGCFYNRNIDIFDIFPYLSYMHVLDNIWICTTHTNRINTSWHHKHCHCWHPIHNWLYTIPIALKCIHNYTHHKHTHSKTPHHYPFVHIIHHCSILITATAVCIRSVLSVNALYSWLKRFV